MRGMWQGSGTWQTSGGGRGGLVLVVVIAALAIGSGAASAAVSALVTILVIVGCVVGLGLAAITGLLIWRIRSERPGAPIGARQASPIPPDPRPQLEGSHKPAIEPPREYHLHIHGVSADELAAALRRINHEE